MIHLEIEEVLEEKKKKKKGYEIPGRLVQRENTRFVKFLLGDQGLRYAITENSFQVR